MALAHLGTVATATSTTNNNNVGATFNQTIPAGTLLVVSVGVVATGETIAACTVTDSESHSYSKDAELRAGTSQDTFVFSVVTESELTSSDTITATFGTTYNRKILIVEAFTADWNENPADQVASNYQAGGSTTFSIGPTSPLSSVPQLAFAVTGRNGNVEPTAGTGWTGGTWLYTSAGSSDRGIYTIWREVTEAGTVTAQFNFAASSTTRNGLLVTYAFTGPAKLATPSNFAFERVLGQRKIIASWDTVPDADGYLLEVHELAPGGDPDDPGDWSPLSPEDEFPTTSNTVELDQTDGLGWGRTYRGRVRAVAEEE